MADLRCTRSDIEKYKDRLHDDNMETVSSVEQIDVETTVNTCFEEFKRGTALDPNNFMGPILQRDRHIQFLIRGLQRLSESYECLDASRPWLCYWILHSLELLDVPIPEDIAANVAFFIGKCQDPEGGFAGGPEQEPHLAPTYAAVNALCILGTEEAYKVINRKTLSSFLSRMHCVDGGFKMHSGGEVDIRGAYCAASAARLANVITPELFDKTPEWIVSCQTYEGGFGGCPGMEAHGGYSFCGIAALILLGHERLCDIQALLRWTTNRQMRFEGGFQGRTNKLVDGCYSFWQGGALPLIHLALSMQNDQAVSAETWMFDQGALQEYVLVCCQYPGGGLIDKPEKKRDYYHTCYCLSGLSVAQHFAGGKIGHKLIIGHEENELKTTHPLFNIGTDMASRATQYFSNLPVPGTKS